MPRKAHALFETLEGPSQKYATDPAIIVACMFVSNG